MSEEEIKIRDVFAAFGRTMYLAQNIEKGMMNIVLIDKLKNSITKMRFDELTSELSNQTFGQLKREIQNTKIFTDLELKQINDFQKKRDFLAHSFWWERAIELSVEKLQNNLIKELNEISDSFELINFLIDEKTDLFKKQNNLDIKKISENLKSTEKTIPIEQFQKLRKNETIISIFSYRNTPNSKIPIFQFIDNTYWTVCEIGLSQYKDEIVEENKLKISKLDIIFPIEQFNPRPKVIENWNYELDLKKKGIKMIISRKGNNSRMEWEIK